MKKALLPIMIILLIPLSSAFAQQQDSMIIGSMTMDTSQAIVWLPFYGVTFDSLGYYDVQVQVNGSAGGILMGNIIQYYPPLTGWLHDDATDIALRMIRQVGWVDSAAPLYTAGQRVHLWSITFMITHGTPPQTVSIDLVGGFSFGDNPAFVPGYVYYAPLGIEEPLHPEGFALSQNYPNPFNASTIIEFSLTKEEDVTLAVYDLLGRQIRTLQNGVLGEGTYSIVWNGKDNAGRGAPSGTYFYCLKTNEFSQTKRMTLLR